MSPSHHLFYCDFGDSFGNEYQRINDTLLKKDGKAPPQSEPCFHSGPCSPKNLDKDDPYIRTGTFDEDGEEIMIPNYVCSCVRNALMCEKSCFCECGSKCARRFKGCSCKCNPSKQSGNTCVDNNNCECFVANRECDPDLCRKCNCFLPPFIIKDFHSKKSNIQIQHEVNDLHLYDNTHLSPLLYDKYGIGKNLKLGLTHLDQERRKKTSSRRKMNPRSRTSSERTTQSSLKKRTFDEMSSIPIIRKLLEDEHKTDAQLQREDEEEKQQMIELKRKKVEMQQKGKKKKKAPQNKKKKKKKEDDEDILPSTVDELLLRSTCDNCQVLSFHILREIHVVCLIIAFGFV